MIKALIFDWGDTIMRDFPGKAGPMCDWEKVEWIPGAQTALQELSEKYICIIATGAGESDTAMMRKALRRLDAEKYFTYFFSAKELGTEKPDPIFFTKIADMAGFTPEECIHIGNLYHKDISGAKAAGMFTVLFNEKELEGDFPDADAVIARMYDLPEVIEAISAI